MTIQLSAVLAAQSHARGSHYFRALELTGEAKIASPVTVMFDSRATGRPISPHPHAGFSAVTYIFEDSAGGLRNRDSLGNDVTVGPGGIVWTEAGRGVVHHEMPADRDRELHGLVVFVNMARKNKLTTPRVMWLQGGEVPIWRNEAGDRVRVVVGAYGGISSPLLPLEPFTFLDAQIETELSFDLQVGQNAIAYVARGQVQIHAGGAERKIGGSQAVALYGGGGAAKFEALGPSQLVLLSGAAIDEPLLFDFPFIMNDQAQIAAAEVRFRSGAMGALPPLPAG